MPASAGRLSGELINQRRGRGLFPVSRPIRGLLPVSFTVINMFSSTLIHKPHYFIKYRVPGALSLLLLLVLSLFLLVSLSPPPSPSLPSFSIPHLSRPCFPHWHVLTFPKFSSSSSLCPPPPPLTRWPVFTFLLFFPSLLFPHSPPALLFLHLPIDWCIW